MSVKSIHTTPGEKLLTAFFYAVVIIFSLLIILPTLNLLALSLNDGQDAAKGGIFIFPRVLTFENYIKVFEDGDLVGGYKITLARTFLGTLLTLIVTSFAAYALREKTLPFRRPIIFFITFTMLFGGGTVPTYIVYKELHLLDNFMVYIVPSLVSVTYLMIMRANFEAIPDSLFESAELDGANDWDIYVRVVLPLSKAVFAVIALYVAVGHWNDWFAGAFYMSSTKMWPVQTHLKRLLDSATKQSREFQNAQQAINAARRGLTSSSLQMAAVVITVVPILCIYPFVQKYFAKGALTGAVKG